MGSVNHFRHISEDRKSTLLPLLTDDIPDTDQPTAADGTLLVGCIGAVFQGY